eukprot:747383-Hanusia_phi.AAC.1
MHHVVFLKEMDERHHNLRQSACVIRSSTVVHLSGSIFMHGTELEQCCNETPQLSCISARFLHINLHCTRAASSGTGRHFTMAGRL